MLRSCGLNSTTRVHFAEKSQIQEESTPQGPVILRNTGQTSQFYQSESHCQQHLIDTSVFGVKSGDVPDKVFEEQNPQCMGEVKLRRSRVEQGVKDDKNQNKKHIDVIKRGSVKSLVLNFEKKS